MCIFILFVDLFCGMLVYCFSLTPVYNGDKSHVPRKSSKNISDNGLFAQKIHKTEHLEPSSLLLLEDLSCKNDRGNVIR